MRRGRVFSVLLIAAAIAVIAFADPPALVETRSAWLFDQEYFPAVRREIRAAKKDIIVTVYVFRVYPHANPKSPTFVLLQELLEARRRGVKVRVILERTCWQNETAREMLAAGGVDARYASGGNLLHQKVVVIDDDTCLVGSHNWSDSALKFNHEVSELVRSKTQAKRMRERIAGIALRAPEEEASGGYVRVPSRIVTDPDLAAAMVNDHDNRSFELFLQLWREHVGRPKGRRGEMTVQFKVYAARLGLDKTMDDKEYRAAILRVLRKLDREYGLISLTQKHGGTPTVKIGLRMARGESGLAVPVEFWEYGWLNTLGLSEKMLYLVALRETEESRNRPWWSLSLDRIAQKYGIHRWTANQALLALEREEILEVRRSSAPEAGGYEHRCPNDYRLKPLMSPEDIQAEWGHLESTYGKKKLEKARELAGRLNRPNSRDVTETYLKLMKKYTMAQIESATDYVARLAPDNPMRHIGTVINRLTKLHGGGKTR